MKSNKWNQLWNQMTWHYLNPFYFFQYPKFSKNLWTYCIIPFYLPQNGQKLQIFLFINDRYVMLASMHFICLKFMVLCLQMVDIITQLKKNNWKTLWKKTRICKNEMLQNLAANGIGLMHFSAWTSERNYIKWLI